MTTDDRDPFTSPYQIAKKDDWVYFPRTKIIGLVISVDRKTNSMRVHCFNSMNLRWFINNNFGQYKVL